MKIKFPEFSSIFVKSPEKEIVNKISDFELEKLGEKKVFLAWEALGRAEKSGEMGIKFTRTFTIIGVFVGLVLMIMQEFFLILAVGSVIFVVQALTKATPEIVKYEFSNHGLLINETLYYWDQLKRYFFILRDGGEAIAIDTTLGFPGRLFISFIPKDKEEIKRILDQRLFFLKEEPKTFLDTAYEKILDKFDIQNKE
ncbi:hypothetical protein KKG08_03340 [Patescibacteria group bacterium]|nr:hypothetical protein [Patescibacteria group bacterium]